MIADERCGRLTNRGTACQNFPLAGWNVAAGTAVPPCCGLHLTAAEYEPWKAAVAAEEQRRRAAYAAWQACAPACWAWTDMPDPATWTLPAARLAAVPELADVPEYCGDAMMQAWQDGRCAVCDRRNRRLVEDHDHVTGLVRGYLCSNCNTREGFCADENSPFGRYRRRNPASMLGLRLRYWDPFAQAYAEPLPAWQPFDRVAESPLNGIGL